MMVFGILFGVPVMWLILVRKRCRMDEDVMDDATITTIGAAGSSMHVKWKIRRVMLIE